jgi:hypothetical protein
MAIQSWEVSFSDGMPPFVAHLVRAATLRPLDLSVLTAGIQSGGHGKQTTINGALRMVALTCFAPDLVEAEWRRSPAESAGLYLLDADSRHDVGQRLLAALIRLHD